jgi:MerR family mercuric resistance operon transcriptional regulator
MAKTVKEFTIGALSKHTGVKVETIRYYEKSGIMPNPPRSAGGFRMYRQEHLNRLRFIRRCRQLGFSMSDIEGLLGLVDDRGYTCGEVRALTVEHADLVKQKITDLKRLEKTLRGIAAQCTGKEVPECPIIDALLDPSDRLALQS